MAVGGTAPVDAEGSKQTWLLRLFESKLFDITYAVMYLFNSKETGVQTYIGNRVFSFPEREVDFYLQQLVNMYIHMHDIAEALHPYLVIGRNVFHLRPIGRRLYAVGAERWLRSVSDDSSFDVDVWRIGSSVP